MALDGKAQSRLANTQMLNAVAGVLLAALAGFLAFILDKRDPSLLFWLMIIVGVVAIVFSFICSGRGVHRIDAMHSFFDWQAKLVFAAFVVLGLSLIFIGPPKHDDTVTRLETLAKNVGLLDKKLESLNSSIQADGVRLDSLSKQIAQVQADVAKIQKGLRDRKK